MALVGEFKSSATIYTSKQKSQLAGQKEYQERELALSASQIPTHASTANPLFATSQGIYIFSLSLAVPQSELNEWRNTSERSRRAGAPNGNIYL